VLRLGDALRMQGLGNDLAERALTDADRAFDSDVPWWFEEVRHDNEKN
jgi:predicted GNAT family acetyltransferase